MTRSASGTAYVQGENRTHLFVRAGEGTVKITAGPGNHAILTRRDAMSLVTILQAAVAQLESDR